MAILRREKFEPYPEDAEVVGSFLDVELDESDQVDGDDEQVPPDAPGWLGRLLRRPPPNVR